MARNASATSPTRPHVVHLFAVYCFAYGIGEEAPWTAFPQTLIEVSEILCLARSLGLGQGEVHLARIDQPCSGSERAGIAGEALQCVEAIREDKEGKLVSRRELLEEGDHLLFRVGLIENRRVREIE
jgi:hypothetical protein